MNLSYTFAFAGHSHKLTVFVMKGLLLKSSTNPEEKHEASQTKQWLALSGSWLIVSHGSDVI